MKQIIQDLFVLGKNRKIFPKTIKNPIKILNIKTKGNDFTSSMWIVGTKKLETVEKFHIMKEHKINALISKIKIFWNNFIIS